MTSISRRNLLLVTAGLAGVLQLGAAQAEDLNITIGYQTVVEPSKVAQADGAYEAATKAAIDWRKFDSGADVIAAIASGALDIGYVGSSPLAAAASRELPIQTIFVVGLIGESEALVARNGAGVEKIADLAGKKVAVPFVSTTHYSLLAALKHEGVDPKSVEILNLRPPEIAAAWQRGDIDAAYVWDPALGQIRTSGRVIARFRQGCRMGRADLRCLDRPHRFRREAPGGRARLRQGDRRCLCRVPERRRSLVELRPSRPPRSPSSPAPSWRTCRRCSRATSSRRSRSRLRAKFLGGATVKAVEATSAFLKEQGKIDAVLPTTRHMFRQIRHRGAGLELRRIG